MRIYVDNSPRIKLGRTMGWASSLAMLLVFMFGGGATYSQWAEHSFAHDGKSRDYWVFLPHNFQPKMPVVFITQYDGTVYRKAAKDAGARVFLGKECLSEIPTILTSRSSNDSAS